MRWLAIVLMTTLTACEFVSPTPTPKPTATPETRTGRIAVRIESFLGTAELTRFLQLGWNIEQVYTDGQGSTFILSSNELPRAGKP